MQNLHAYLDTIESRFPGHDTPGYHCLISRRGSIEFERSFGYANLEWRVPNDGATVFHIGSESKQFTGYLVMKLIKDGRLKLTDDVRFILDYCRDFPFELPVVDLVRHTSGVADYASKNLELLGLDGKATASTAGGRAYFSRLDAREAIEQRASLQQRPGLTFAYSNANYVILADVVESIVGENFAKVAHDLIFEPLGMTDTLFEARRQSVVRRRATAYAPDLLERGKYHSRLKNFDVIGDVGILTTGRDLAKWECLFWDDRTEQSAVVKSMLNFPGVPRGEGLIYGCGMEFGKAGDTSYISHGGRMEGFKSVILRIPSSFTSFIYVSNCDVPSISSEAIGRQIASLCSAYI